MSKRNFLALAFINGLGPEALKKIELHFLDLSDFFKESHGALKALGLNDKLISQIKNPPWLQVEKSLRWAEEERHQLLTWQDKDYPALLREIPSPPPMLFIKGRLSSTNQALIAMVGSRRASAAGLDNAYQFAHSLAKNGVGIVSGLALGIDGRSHQGALDAGGQTYAVLGTGIDKFYPTKHKSLAADIVAKGALISEFPLGTEPRATHFPRRNRIISGLSLGVLVVEATLKSGSLITANYALNQGREVFAMPSSIHNPKAKGCHALIQQGAKLIEKIDDIASEFAIDIVNKSVKNSKNSTIKLENSLQNLVKFVDYELTSMDVLQSRCGLSHEKITRGLVELELKGLIRAVPGGYQRV